MKYSELELKSMNRYKRYYERNKPRLQATSLKRYHLTKESTKEKRLKYQQKYYKLYKEKKLAANRLWQKNNPEQYKRMHADVQLRRRARIKSVKNDGYNRALVYKHFGGYCIVCDETINLKLKFPNMESFTIHHLIPISKGGDNTFNNVAPAHFSCNLSVGNKVPIAIKPRVLI